MKKKIIIHWNNGQKFEKYYNKCNPNKSSHISVHEQKKRSVLNFEDYIPGHNFKSQL